MTQPSSIVVCFAVKDEARPFAQRLMPGPLVKVLVTGMGAANARRVVGAALREQKPGLLLSCGFAGGLRPDLASGTVVYAAQHAPELERKLAAAGAVPVHFHCAERVVVTRLEKQQLRETTGADAVEMESGPIGELCDQNQVPHAVIRVILDTANQDLPFNFNELLTADLRVSLVRMATTLVKAPIKMAALFELRNQTRRAASNLAEVLAGITGETVARA